MCFLFFFNDTATTEIYTLSLHDALPISLAAASAATSRGPGAAGLDRGRRPRGPPHHQGRSVRLDRSGLGPTRSEEHTSELQLRQYLVCRLLLEKKNNNILDPIYIHTNAL